MKIIPAITFIISLVLLSNSFAQEQESNTLLEGTWVLAAFKYTLPDTVITGNSKSFNSIKIFGKSHFTYIGKALPDHVFKRAGGGRYQLNGDQLTEIMDFSSLANMLGKTFKYKYRIEEDTYFHSGQINDLYVEEIWKKLE
ncbi:MAG: hypothetical protein HKO83_07080 [Ignavibacteriaceae bacterium]|nr:hypothetical protein [Ignavibacteriaceae bacterium]